ncbi:hypothetical protein ACFWBN_20235 [Streptomyces sp. NPDC059989]|uniref:hypothetical protein n=1 Tax=Streptomyces sp. NPDC059989 TaxID=3347026 RepID=UPI00368DFBC3
MRGNGDRDGGGAEEEHKEQEPGTDPRPSLWKEARRSAVLGLAGAACPLLLVLAEWWARTH